MILRNYRTEVLVPMATRLPIWVPHGGVIWSHRRGGGSAGTKLRGDIDLQDEALVGASAARLAGSRAARGRASFLCCRGSVPGYRSDAAFANLGLAKAGRGRARFRNMGRVGKPRTRHRRTPRRRPKALGWRQRSRANRLSGHQRSRALAAPASWEI